MSIVIVLINLIFVNANQLVELLALFFVPDLKDQLQEYDKIYTSSFLFKLTLFFIAYFFLSLAKLALFSYLYIQIIENSVQGMKKFVRFFIILTGIGMFVNFLFFTISDSLSTLIFQMLINVLICALFREHLNKMGKEI